MEKQEKIAMEKALGMVNNVYATAGVVESAARAYEAIATGAYYKKKMELLEKKENEGLGS